jgi:hypothetical protein
MNLNRLNKENLNNKTKAFFRSNKWKNFLVFFSFVVLAFVFWLMRFYQQKFEIELSIPLRYEEVPSGIVLSDSLPDFIHLKIQDKGTVLLNYLFSKNWGAINIDLKNISLKQEPYLLQRNVISNKLYEYLSPSTQLISFYPENIAIHYFPLNKKEVPVVLANALSLAPGYIFVDSVTINPSTITVYGNKQALDTIREIRTEPVKKSNINKQMDMSLDLQIPRGIHTSTNKVKLSANVEAYTEKSFELPVVSTNLPENLYVRFFPSTVTLICQVPLSKYTQLTEKDLKVSVDYNELKRNKNTMPFLQLSKKPKGLINYRILPDRVEYLIEQKREL